MSRAWRGHPASPRHDSPGGAARTRAAALAAGHDDARFSHTVAAFLDDAYNRQRYDKLCVVAAAPILRRLHQDMPMPVQHAVEADLPCDMAAMSVRQIEQYVGAKINLH